MTAPAPTIVLMKFAAITNAYRKQFDAFWRSGSPAETGAQQVAS